MKLYKVIYFSFLKNRFFFVMTSNNEEEIQVIDHTPINPDEPDPKKAIGPLYTSINKETIGLRKTEPMANLFVWSPSRISKYIYQEIKKFRQELLEDVYPVGSVWTSIKEATNGVIEEPDPAWPANNLKLGTWKYIGVRFLDENETEDPYPSPAEEAGTAYKKVIYFFIRVE